MKFQTKITNVQNNQETIAGYSLPALIEHVSFSDTIWLLLRGELPTPTESKMFGAILTSAIDHGPGTASAQTARLVASTKTSVQAAVAAGLLALGERHGAALESAAHFLVTHFQTKNLPELLADCRAQKMRIPGFGHAVLTHDERGEALLTLAKETGFYIQYTKFAEEISVELNKTASKTLPLNIDGAMAAILLEMGFSPNALTGIFIIARTPGLVAQVTEEMTSDVGLRRLSEAEIEYLGPASRTLPK